MRKISQNRMKNAEKKVHMWMVQIAKSGPQIEQEKYDTLPVSDVLYPSRVSGAENSLSASSIVHTASG